MIYFGGDLMFYDERIENAKGRIARKAILISLGISLVLGAIHLFNIIRNAPETKFFWFAGLEIAIVIGCLTVLVIGFIRSKLYARDERTLSEQNAFYNRSASVLMKFVLGVFAFVKPIALYIGKPVINFSDPGFGGILDVLLFIVGIYVVCGFRRNDIYFNYSIMDSDRYYKGVLKNMGRFGLYALAFFGISVVSFVGIIALKTPESERVVRIFLDMMVYYVGTFAEVALLYLLYSFLEKSSYRNENSISRSSVISLGITIFLYAVYTAAVIFIDSLPISQANVAWLVSLIAPIDVYILFALLIFITYFGYEYQRVRNNKLLSAACAIILLSEPLIVFLDQIIGYLIFVFMPEILGRDGYIINQFFSTVSTFVEDALCLANIVGFVLMIFALTKDQMICKAHRWAIFGFVILGGVELFLRTQVDFLSVRIYHFVAEIIVLCYFAVIVACVAVKVKKKSES